MDAVSERKVKVWFGGCYREQWSENYILSIIYENRRCVEAAPGEGGWLPAGGDEELCRQLLSPDCPELMREYFQAAATVYDAVRECLRADSNATGSPSSCTGRVTLSPRLNSCVC